MLEFARGVHGVGVHHRQPGAQNAHQSNGILQHVGQHDRYPVAFLEAQLVAQITGKLQAQLVEFTVADHLVHVDESGAMPESVKSDLHHVGH